MAPFPWEFALGLLAVGAVALVIVVPLMWFLAKTVEWDWPDWVAIPVMLLLLLSFIAVTTWVGMSFGFIHSKGA